jgi:ring-1,2-phenylacetyl-CoA epoxidase subunit PaaA
MTVLDERLDGWAPAADQLIEPWDDAPERYWAEIRKMVVFQAIAEIVGTTMVAPWVAKAPTFFRKQVITAKVQDEIGHGQVCTRVAEDLGVSRVDLVEGYLEGRYKLLNAFQYDIGSWPEFAISSILNNSAAMVQFRTLVHGSYGPYVRALKKIIAEEAFHYQQACDLVRILLSDGEGRWREEIEAGLTKWFPIMLAFFGPAREDPERMELLRRWRIKPRSNEEVRQQWLTKIVPVLHDFGLTIPDPQLQLDAGSGTWSYTEPDWVEVKRVIDGHGPASNVRRELVRQGWERHRWVREALAAA